MESPVDKIRRRIRHLISTGQLSPGDQLPAERKLSERFGVSRGPVRDALQKLAFYGILKTMPQSGTVVAGMGIVALKTLGQARTILANRNELFSQHNHFSQSFNRMPAFRTHSPEFLRLIFGNGAK